MSKSTGFIQKQGPSHDMFDPSVRYPNLRLLDPVTGAVLRSCRLCGAMEVRDPKRQQPCRGPSRVVLRDVSEAAP